MDDLFFSVPSENSYDPMLEAYSSELSSSLDESVRAERNPVADPYLSVVYGFGVDPASSAWLLDSGWNYMPEQDRDGFVAAILEVFPNQVEALQTLYMNAFERLGDPEGLAFWTLNMVFQQTNDPFVLLNNVINESPEYVGMLKTVLADQPALTGLNTGQAIEAHIRTLDSAIQRDLFARLTDHLYDNVLGRAADTGGKAYWTAELASGNVTLLNILGALITGAGTDDQALLAQKSEIAYDAVTALVNRNVITTQDIAKLGTDKVTTALSNMQERLSSYDASELVALDADRDILIAQLLQEIGAA
jgi:hypothetical protein